MHAWEHLLHLILKCFHTYWSLRKWVSISKEISWTRGSPVISVQQLNHYTTLILWLSQIPSFFLHHQCLVVCCDIWNLIWLWVCFFFLWGGSINSYTSAFDLALYFVGQWICSIAFCCHGESDVIMLWLVTASMAISSLGAEATKIVLTWSN